MTGCVAQAEGEVFEGEKYIDAVGAILSRFKKILTNIQRR